MQKQSRGYPYIIKWPLRNQYTHLDEHIVFRYYEKHIPRKGVWLGKGECLSYLWKQSGINKRNGPDLNDLRKDAVLYVVGQLEKARKEPLFYPIVSFLKSKGNYTEPAIRNWDSYRVDQYREIKARAERFEAAWILEALPYIGVRKDDEERRAAATMLFLTLCWPKRLRKPKSWSKMQRLSEHIFAQPKAAAPHEVYINFRLRTIASHAIVDLRQTIEYEQQAKKREESDMMEKVLLALQVNLALEPILDDLKVHYPALAHLLPLLKA